MTRAPHIGRWSVLIAAASVAMLSAQSGSGQRPSGNGQRTTDSGAETVYYNGNIVTMWAEHPVVEAVAILGDRFVAAGTTADVRRLAGPATNQIDLRGRTVLPGLEDSHTHPIAAALSEQGGPVPVMNSIPEILTYIRKLAAATPPDGVIFVPKISKDFLHCPADEIKDIEALLTIVGGRVVYRNAAMKE